MEKEIKFFKIFNNDLARLPDKNIITLMKTKHFKNRILSEEDFYKRYRKFDYEFYKSAYNDLQKLDYYQLLRHYHFFGRNECRFINKKQLDNKIKNIDFKLPDKYLLKILKIEDYTLVEIYHKNPNIFFIHHIKKKLNIFQNLDINFVKSFYNLESRNILKEILKNYKSYIKHSNSFNEKYPNYDDKFFYNFNKGLVNSELKKYKLEYNQLNLKKIYHNFIANGYEFINTPNDYCIKHNISRKNFNLFNPDFEDISDLDFLNLVLQKTDLIFDKSNFKQKYPQFNYTIFKKFNTTDDTIMECMSKYHINYDKERMIGCIKDFYFVYPDFEDSNIQLKNDINSDDINLDDINLEELVIYHKKKTGEIDLELDELMEIYPEFNHTFYTSVYTDIREFDEYESIKHWHYYGKDEGRVYQLEVSNQYKMERKKGCSSE